MLLLLTAKKLKMVTFAGENASQKVMWQRRNLYRY